MTRSDRSVGVIGLGYVGLPLAIAFAEAGLSSTGFDLDAGRVSALMAGRSHIEDVTSEHVASAVASGRFQATTSGDELAAVDAIFICVPTPFDDAKTPDLSYVQAATATAASVLRAGTLVILQSTTWPGTTTEVVQPILEGTGLKAGVDFDLAFSPERVDPGNARWTVSNTPKVVGGVTPESAERAKALLEAIMDEPGLVTALSSPAAAEMAKLLENTYRAVNIALVNELAMLAHEMGIDLWEVIDAAATKPFGFQPFYPGIGPGGHCIPVDPYYLAWKAREFDFQTKFIELAADTNLRMASYAVGRVTRFLNARGKAVSGSRVLCLGAAFKAGVSDVRNSRAVRVMELLSDLGADVSYSDPMVPEVAVGDAVLSSVPITLDVLRATDCVVVLVSHPGWPIAEIAESGVAVFDAVAATGLSGIDIEKL